MPDIISDQPDKNQKISIIVPVLNEEEGIETFLSALTCQLALTAAGSAADIILADGGSSDRTLEIASAFNKVRIVRCGAANRGLQMNKGSRAASGEILLFLHADVSLPANSLDSITAALSDPKISGGAFQITFPPDSPVSLSRVAWAINLRTRLFTTATGDQAIFIRRDIFEKLGGYPEIPLFEDITLFNAMKNAGRAVILPGKVEISPRRWLSFGVWRTVMLMYLLRGAFWLGFDPVKMKKLFVDVREKKKFKV
ncbi:MAG: TIGR04283 family arsenosugar biosynthesis glycosyltransferase [Acidobacteria bacterium]|nr:TIGR04283 family arsenosugar biosynthesis glycosyltransferase [Acidobacteriota bacterium]